MNNAETDTSPSVHLVTSCYSNRISILFPTASYSNAQLNSTIEIEKFKQFSAFAIKDDLD